MSGGRRGVVSAGTWCVDLNKTIARWPEQDTASEILEIDAQAGGSGSNMAFDLKRLDRDFPVEAQGLVGDDDNGRFLQAQCDAFGIARSGLKARQGAPTQATDCFNAVEGGRRTHFFHQGVAAFLAPEDFDFSSTHARYLHLGLPGAHRRMDAAVAGEANGWVATLKAARAAGLKTNLELMTIGREKLFELAAPCLPHLDMLIVNDFEIGVLGGVETRRGEATDVAAVFRAVEAVFARGPMAVVAAHFPEGSVVAMREGAAAAVGSVAVPAESVRGVNGAGDAFAAGFLYGVHEGWDLQRSGRLAHACAAASLREASTTTGVVGVAECLELAARWGSRPMPT